MITPAASKLIRIALPFAWATSVVVGLIVLIDYSSAPGDMPQSRNAPSSAKAIALPLGNNQSTAVMFLHPQCPCSISSVREFGRLISRAQDDTAVRFVIYQPEEEHPGWRDTELVRMATELAGGTENVLFDCGGKTARECGVNVSGHLMVFSPDGACRYSGGTTLSRGHEGDNAGANQAFSALTNEDQDFLQCSPVYGCQLFALEAKNAE